MLIRACSIAAVASLSEAPQRQVEAQRRRRRLRLMIHRQRNPLRLEVRHRRQRNHRSRRALHVNILERVRIALERLVHLHHHVILVQRHVRRRNLLLPERVRQRRCRSPAARLPAGSPCRGRSPAAPAAPAPAGRSPRPSAPAASAIASISFGDHSFSSSRLSAVSEYWYCVAVFRPPIRSSCCDCRNSCTPGIPPVFGRSRLMIASAESPSSARSASGFKNMNMLPELLPPPPGPPPPRTTSHSRPRDPSARSPRSG